VNNTCVRCQRPVHDNAPCCSTCTQEAVEGLAHLVGLDHDLETTRTRRDHHGAPGPRASAHDDEPSLPVNLRARTVHDRAHGTLGRWSRIAQHYATAAQPLTGPACVDGPRTSCGHSSCRALDHERQPRRPALADLARDVAEHLDYLRVRDDAGALFDDIARTREAIERVCDSPPTLVELGQCFCGRHLRAPRDTILLRCKGCGHVHDVPVRKAHLLTRIEILKYPPPVIALVLSAWMEVPLPVATIHTWINRGHLRSRGCTVCGRPGHDGNPCTGQLTYCIGDARARHLASIKRKLKAAAAATT
jgi:hypothetical protein